MDKEFEMPNDSARRAVSSEISKFMKSCPLHLVQGVVKDLIDGVGLKEWDGLKRRFPSLRPLNWDEVIELSRKGNVTIGSHGMWHICCHDRQQKDEVSRQLSQSRQIIEDRLQLSCDYFAYPNGNYTDYSNACVESLYKLGFSAETQTQVSLEHKCILPRIVGYVNLNLFKISLIN